MNGSDPQDRFEFLADAAMLVGESLDLADTLGNIARLAVPTMGTWASVYLVQPNRELKRLASAHAEPTKAALMRELSERYPVSPSPDHPVRRAITTGQPVRVNRTPRKQLDRFATDAEHARILRELGASSALIVPLIARGQTLGAISIGPDSTGRFADWVLPTAKRLAQIAARAIDNARLYEEARDAIRTRDEFLASATHDLKTPLTAISGLAQVMERRARRMPYPEAEKLRVGLAKITTVTQRMTALINELMDVARLRMGRRLQLERHPTDLVAVTRTMAAEASMTSNRHQIEVTARPPEIIGQWDGFRLERVLGNLLSNAIKYSPDGGKIAIDVSLQEGALGKWAVLAVRDPGIGIPSADLPRIFERFHRGTNVLGRIRGTGIGLYGARQIVAAHGGEMRVESEEGIGTTFTVLLPIDPPGELEIAA